MMPTPERSLALLLRFVGAVCVVAVVPLLMPRAWIERTHELMGLGTFPDAPIAEYLARATSALSAFYGGLLIVLSFDVRRYGRVITYQAVAIMSLTTCGIFLGYRAGMPLKWLMADAVSCWAFCVPTLWLQRSIAASR